MTFPFSCFQFFSEAIRLMDLKQISEHFKVFSQMGLFETEGSNTSDAIIATLSDADQQSIANSQLTPVKVLYMHG